MPSKSVVPSLRLDEAKLRKKLEAYFIEAMQRAEDELLAIMKVNVDERVLGDGPGKPEWRQELDRELHQLYIKIVGDYIQGAVGVEHNDGSPE